MISRRNDKCFWQQCFKTKRTKSHIPLRWSPGCRSPGCIVIWMWSLATLQLRVVWLLTGIPEQRYRQNRDTANIGLDSSVGRAPARSFGGRWFESHSSQFFVQPRKSFQNLPSQFPLWFILTNEGETSTGKLYYTSSFIMSRDSCHDQKLDLQKGTNTL